MRWIVAVLMFTSLAAGQNGPALTIYNQDFAVVRQPVHLDLQQGQTTVRYNEITSELEPDSVVLRDPSGKRRLQILEQNYLSDPLSQQSLLELFEGKSVDFEVTRGDKADIVQGRIVRAGRGMPRYTRIPQLQPCWQAAQIGCAPQEPLIEVNGKLQLGLPGRPLFPALPQDMNLKPTLDWTVAADGSGPLDAELSYVTGGMTWAAAYNVIAPLSGNTLELIGWVNMENYSGRGFENAHIQLMAGDVNKIKPGYPFAFAMAGPVNGIAGGVGGGAPVTESAFDDYHLYTLARTTTLRDGESKQVEFVRASGIPGHRMYVFDGGRLDPQRFQGQNWEYLRFQREIGTTDNTKIWIMQEFKNSQQNHLGMPLPKGRLRFYRRDDSGALQFIGENTIDHTPKDETIRVYSGNAFDLVGERRRTNFRSDQQQAFVDESFEITVRNHKKESVDVTLVEHLYRGAGWDITSKSTKYSKKDSSTIEFPVTVPADGEQTVTYAVHYSW